MELREFTNVLRRNWIIVGTAIVAGMLAALLVSLFSKPMYSSSTQLFVSLQNTDNAIELQQASTFTAARTATYAETARTPAVLQPVIDELNLDMTANELTNRVSASANPETVLITITAEAPEPELAADIANETGESLIQVVSELETPSSSEESPIKLSTVTPASASDDPVSPNVLTNIAVGLILGLMLGVVLALLRAKMDTRIRSEQDLQLVSDAPVLANIPFDDDAKSKPLITQSPVQSPKNEAFRHLRTNLQFAQVGRERKPSVLVTSSLPGEGKTSTCANLAIAVAESGLRVVAVEADLRRPRLSHYFGIDNSVGLTTVLLGKIGLSEALQRWGNGSLHILSSGAIPPNPAELLGSPSMTQMIKQLSDDFDLVIIDGPPLLPVTDSAVLSQSVGGVAMVVSAKDIKSPVLERSLSSLGMVEATIYGIVLNKTPKRGSRGYSYSYEYDSKSADFESYTYALDNSHTSGYGDAIKSDPVIESSVHKRSAHEHSVHESSDYDESASTRSASLTTPDSPSPVNMGFDLEQDSSQNAAPPEPAVRISDQKVTVRGGESSTSNTRLDDFDFDFEQIVFSNGTGTEERRRRGRHSR